MIPGQSVLRQLQKIRQTVDNLTMMTSWLTLSNRQENLKLLLDYVGKWAGERGLSDNRRRSLEKAATEIFRHLLTHAYRPDQPGSIAVSLEERGSRLRLMFEDDAAPHNPGGHTCPAPEGAKQAGGALYDNLQHIAESLIYYRTADRKNRMAVFLA
jgi:anti-sigma regulatory factor (Ser/Thr protein kinase)